MLTQTLADARARFDLASRAGQASTLTEIRLRMADLKTQGRTGGDLPDATSARAAHEQSKDRAAGGAARVEGLEARLPLVRRRAEDLASTFGQSAELELANAEKEERTVPSSLAAAEVDQEPEGAKLLAVQDLQDAQQAAGLVEQRLLEARARSTEATRARDERRARLERARGDVEACQRQAVGLDQQAAEAALSEARSALEAILVVSEPTPGDSEIAGRALEDAEHELKSCEAALHGARGKLALVSGRVGLERLEDEREAIGRAREHAEDQELDYEAARLLLQSLEGAESKRSAHLGRCLAKPVARRFLELTGNLYAHVSLDPDLRTEGVAVAGGERKIEELSVGTREQLATLIRLAIAAQLKTVLVLDDQLVHSDSWRLGWFREQLRTSVLEHDHQVIVMTCRPMDYVPEQSLVTAQDVGSSSDLNVINVPAVIKRAITLESSISTQHAET